MGDGKATVDIARNPLTEEAETYFLRPNELGIAAHTDDKTVRSVAKEIKYALKGKQREDLFTIAELFLERPYGICTPGKPHGIGAWHPQHGQLNEPLAQTACRNAFRDGDRIGVINDRNAYIRFYKFPRACMREQDKWNRKYIRPVDKAVIRPRLLIEA
ncbi:MAG: hypothetical protein VKJ04_07270 [Vampirovibrionales bacterium]|nr:hypothetical protein [Vampirovibrionales bacterium]